MLVAVAVMALSAASLALGLVAIGAPREEVPPEKQAVLDLEQKELEQARLLPEPPHPGYNPPSSTPDPLPPTGILSNPQAPFPAVEGEFFNKWAGIIGGEYVQVVAGVSREDRLQGVVLVWSSRLDPLAAVPAKRRGRYLSPRKVGALRIVAETGGVLTLRSDQGVLLPFDVVNGRFIP